MKEQRGRYWIEYRKHSSKNNERAAKKILDRIKNIHQKIFNKGTATSMTLREGVGIMGSPFTFNLYKY